MQVWRTPITASPQGADHGRVRAVAARIDRLIAAIDLALTRQVNAILHDAAFQAMEARWRSLALIVARADPARGVMVRVLDADWRSLSRNLERADEFDRSHLFRLVYDGEFGMPGGLPFGIIIGDYAVSHRVGDQGGDVIETLRKLAGVAAAAFCPVILGASPQLLGFDDFTAIGAEADIDPDARREDHSIAARRWEQLRRAEECRFLGLVASTLRLRPPYARTDPGRVDGFTFDETRSSPLFGNGAFAFGLTVIDTFLANGWFAAIRGANQDAPGGGRVVGIAPADLGTDLHGLSAQSPISFRPTPSQEVAIIARGLIPLMALQMDREPVFNANPSLHAVAELGSPIATQNARLAAMLQYVLCTSRFAHYLKVIMRDRIGSVATAAAIEFELSKWLRDYCIGNDDAPADMKAQYPLRDAGVTVAAVPGRPGAHVCTIRLQPHFQLDDIATIFQLIAETPAQPVMERVMA